MDKLTNNIKKNDLNNQENYTNLKVEKATDENLVEEIQNEIILKMNENSKKNKEIDFIDFKGSEDLRDFRIKKETLRETRMKIDEEMEDDLTVRFSISLDILSN